METYTVKAGDTLAGIAMKIYGSANKWRELADLNSIANPNSIKIGQVLDLVPKKAATTTGVDNAEITIEKKKAFYRFKGTTAKIFLGNIFKKGLSRIGSFNTEKFIANNPILLTDLKLSSSEINSLLATSENEGNLDSVNTWDNSFLSWGMFQWTMGQDNNAGELAALLKLVKEKQPAAFKTFFGDFGLDMAPDTGDKTGYILINNIKQNTAARKSAFRSNAWALRFALAGKEPAICAVQVLHAINRYNNFYLNAVDEFGGLSINSMLSSEYAASLLLDQHVNRPGHVKDTVLLALKKCKMTAKQLALGTDADELKVINKYLEIRKGFGKVPMTNSDGRAKIIKKYLDKNTISAKKNSFRSNRAVRS